MKKFYSILCLSILLGVYPDQTLNADYWVSNGPYGGVITSIAVDPGNKETIYVTTFGGGVFKTLNGGISWDPVNEGLPLLALDSRSIIINPDNSGHLYLASADGIYQSLDGGDSWTKKDRGLSNSDIRFVALTQRNTKLLYAAASNGVYKSEDSGTNWNLSLSVPDARSVAINPGNTNIVYAATWDGIYKTGNGGTKWDKLKGEPGRGRVWSVTIDPIKNNTVYIGLDKGGIYKSTDSGENWTPQNLGLSNNDIRCLVIDVTAKVEYVGTFGGGVYKRQQGEETWRPISVGLSNTKIRCLSLDSDSIYAGTNGGGIFKSDNKGLFWKEINEGITNTYIEALTAGKGGIIYAGIGFGGGVFKSRHGGESWKAKSEGIMNNTLQDLLVSPDNPEVVYAGTYSQGAFRTINGGEQWKEINKGLLDFSVWSLAASSTTLYAGTGGNGVFASTDGGDNWSPANQGMDEAGIHALAIDPEDEKIVYAGGFTGVFRSDNGGISWAGKNIGLSHTDVRAIGITAEGTLYIGIYGGGIFKSPDRGETWEKANTGLPKRSVLSLSIDRDNEQRIYAGGYEGGVFRTEDGGNTWTQLSQEGLVSPSIMSLMVVGGRVFAGTQGGGVVEYVETPADSTPPGAIIDLTASAPTLNTITLTWAAPGDDGRVGQAAGYDIRYSASRAAVETWDQAAQIKNEPAPKAAGLTETFVVSGLDPETTYYFAIKTLDEEGNVSLRSNIASETTLGLADTTPPCKITDLVAGNPTTHSVTLTWTAPGDDCQTGQAGCYHIRYSTSPINKDNWSAAFQVKANPVPAASGSKETFVVVGLDPATFYYFGIKACDEGGNLSPLSNIASEITLRLADTTPSCRITDLVAGNPTLYSITLAWAAPGDDCQDGQAGCYDIRYSTSSINEDNWPTASQVKNNPIPAAPGSRETFTVDGLNPATLYYFAIKACDEEGNLSPLSNVVAETTLGANRPPQVIITYPIGGEILNGTTDICWQATDPDADELTIDLFVKRYSDSSWTVLAYGEPDGRCYPWDTTTFEDGKDYLIRVVANDGELSGQDQTRTTFAISNHPPIGPAKDLRDALVYPIPYRPSEAYNGALKFIHLTETSWIGIYTITGELVRKLSKRNLGPIPYANAYGLIWDSFNQWGEVAATGVYIYVIADEAGHQKIGKFSLLQ